MKIVKVLAKVLIVVAGFVLVISMCVITLMDRTPYQEMSYYKEWKNEISKLDPDGTTDTVKAGWAKVNITPDQPGPMAGYGNRHGRHYDSVRDSVFVRAIVLDNGTFKTAIVSADLLIIPPTVNEKLKRLFEGSGFDADRIFLGATHSHNSLGGWGKGISGLFFSGKYDAGVEERLAEAIVKAVQLADRQTKPVKITYLEAVDSTSIRNRLVGEQGPVDAEVRSVKFTDFNGKSAILTSYAAHSTILDSQNMVLSRDWPGVLVDSLEKNQVEFAVYMAGAVGSMGPNAKGSNDEDELRNEAAGVYKSLQSPRKTEEATGAVLIQSFRLPLPLREPSPRLSKDLVLRPWVFRKAFGDYPAFVSVLRIGTTLMVGLPCDFSGELMTDLDHYARSKGLNLMVTSFNGGYLGYVTNDKHFEIDKYETYTMSWFGPYNGAYFQEVIRDVIDKLSL